MSKALHRFLLGFYNFTGLLCIKHKNGSYEISHPTAFLNILKLFSSSLFVIFILSNIDIKQKVFLKYVNDLSKLSQFSKMTIQFTAFYFHYITVVLFIKQFAHRHEMKDLLNEALKCKMSEKYLRRFAKLCQSSVKLGIFSCIVIMMKFFSLMNPSFLNFLIFFVFIFPSIFSLAIVSFVKSFENFVVVSLQKLNDELKVWTSEEGRSQFSDIEIYLRFSHQHQELFGFVNKFNKAFGMQMTTLTNSLTILTIFLVSFVVNVFDQEAKCFFQRFSTRFRLSSTSIICLQDCQEF